MFKSVDFPLRFDQIVSYNTVSKALHVKLLYKKDIICRLLAKVGESQMTIQLTEVFATPDVIITN